MCEKVFNEPGNLQRHIKEIHVNSEMKVFQPKISVHEGVESMIHKVRNIFKCDICGKSFSSPGFLKKHIFSVHKGIENHKCDKCVKVFSTYFHLQKHIKGVHEGVKPVQFDNVTITQQGANQQKETVHENKQHKLNVHGGVEFKCGKCDNTFSSVIDLRKHECKLKNENMKSQKILSIVCEVCGECLAAELNLRTHPCLKRHFKYVHEGQQLMLHKCDLCEKIFKSQTFLNKHLNRIHSFVKNNDNKYVA